MVPVNEGNKRIIDKRDDQTPPGSRNTSRSEGRHRDTGDPTGSVEWSSMGAGREGRPKHHAEPRSGVGLVHSTGETLEGNERVEAGGRPERRLLQGEQGRTQSPGF